MAEMLDENQKLLVDLLSAGIRNKPFVADNDNNVAWQALVEEAGKHQVMTLIYRSMTENADRLHIPEKLMQKLRKNVLYEGMEQERNYKEFGKTLEDFNASGIPVIVLKGLVLRELYPDPVLRTMCDFDILVAPCDVEKAGAVLLKSGYDADFDRDKHAVYSHSYLPKIEIHRSMAPSDLFKNYAEFEDKAWKASVPVTVSGVWTLSLGPVDKIAYLVLHIATHMIGSGFGLRQLCDFVLLSEDSEGKVDWEELVSVLHKLGLEQFTRVLFSLCHQLFDLKLPPQCLLVEDDADQLMKSLIQDVFDGGIFGKSNNERITANRMLYYSEGSQAETFLGKLRIYMELLFPKAEKIDVRFGYVRRHKVLLPFAWLHRFFYCFIRKDIDLAEKLTIFTSGSPTSIYTNRSILLKKLGLID